MNLLRNPEIKKSLLVHLSLAGLAVAAGWFHDVYTALCLLAFSALFIFTHYLFTICRYRKLRQLSLELDSMLHSNTPIDFQKYQEGELSILESELSKMTLRLSEQAAALAHDKQFLADSMADISHQIRSPLTASNLILSLLMEQELPLERRRQLLRELTQLLSRIDWLVESLLKISKMDAGTIEFKRLPISVPELIRQAAEPLLIPMELREQTLDIHPARLTEQATDKLPARLTEQATDKLPARLTEQATDELPGNFTEKQSDTPAIRDNATAPQFIGDFAWSTEAILNILKNCMEHTPAGGQIQASFSQNAIFTEIIIEDNGPGFDSEDLPHLFERFYKGKNASEHSVGIGLALARMIVTQQNGTLKAENRPEGGARFVLKFYAHGQSNVK